MLTINSLSVFTERYMSNMFIKLNFKDSLHASYTLVRFTHIAETLSFHSWLANFE